MDESVIVGYYTSEEVPSPAPAVCKSQRKENFYGKKRWNRPYLSPEIRTCQHLDDVAKVQEHNEREKDSYTNQDIVPDQTYLNVHFKAPTDSYVDMFEQMDC